MGRPLLGRGLDPAEPARYDEFGYGLGRADGIYILRYRVDDVLDFTGTRQDFLHQLYVAPAGMLSVRRGTAFGFVGPGEAFWASRAARHEVWASGAQTVHRVCLREPPPALRDVNSGIVRLDHAAADAVVAISRDGVSEDEGLRARAVILDGVDPPAGDDPPGHPDDGPALLVARRIAHDLADPRPLQEWAAELHLSGRTLQRDFHRVFGTTFARWRTGFRLEASKTLLHLEPLSTVARRVGFSGASSFVAAFRTAFGETPMAYRRRTSSHLGRITT
ncbi:AraC family transcriptional regulator [Pseudonocardia phyllosphaerae]|uniref:AraC family transcriptional regulator n=1 Tax=Pseudonocardia phyllosphaerae TaxID=3390502 RepID=UPI00397C3586